MKITIVGSGHGACAMAAVLSMHGHRVSILKLGSTLHLENFDVLRRSKTISLTGIEGEGRYLLDHVTTNPSEAIPGAEIVMVNYVSNFHPMVARSLAPHLHEGQIVIINPGYAGSLVFEKEMAALRNKRCPLFAEFETLPFSSRIIQPGTVHICSRNVRHPFATCPGGRFGEIKENIEPILGECVPRRHVLEVALHNPNLVIHTIGVLMNVAMVENEAKTFAMYRDGFTPSLWNVVFKLDQEKMDVLEKLNVPRIPYFDEFRLRTFEDLRIDGLKGFHHYASEAPDGPFEVEHRYIIEDVPIGLGLLHSLGRATSVPTPVCDSLINLANALVPSHDFWAESRTLKSLWDGTLEELLEHLT